MVGRDLTNPLPLPAKEVNRENNSPNLLQSTKKSHALSNRILEEWDIFKIYISHFWLGTRIVHVEWTPTPLSLPLHTIPKSTDSAFAMSTDHVAQTGLCRRRSGPLNDVVRIYYKTQIINIKKKIRNAHTTQGHSYCAPAIFWEREYRITIKEEKHSSQAVPIVDPLCPTSRRGLDWDPYCRVYLYFTIEQPPEKNLRIDLTA